MGYNMTMSSIVSRSVLVLNAICSGRERLDFAQITEAVGLPKSSTYRILSILREEGLITLDPVRNVFGPGPTLTGWATNVLAAGGLPEVSAPTLSRLSADVKCSTGLSILDQGHVLWLKIVDYPTRHRYSARVGDRVPLHVCAAGKSILAFLDPGTAESIIASLTFQTFTHRTITGPDALKEELADVREAGFATSNREEYLQEVGAAAPVFDHNGDVIGAISMWDMTGQNRIENLLLDKYRLLAAAAEISRQFGFDPDGKGADDGRHLAAAGDG